MSRGFMCPCLGKVAEDVVTLDYRHCSLEHVPPEVFNNERTLEELYLDSNLIRELPRELFYCHGIRKLNICDNDVVSIPPAIASLINLEDLDISKNGILDLPENIKNCKYLASIEASVNPLGKLPEGFTQLLNLTHLYLNDTFLDYLPGNFGRLSKLKILELRENHLKTLPKSLSRLTDLERLDIGNNEFTELPEVIGSLTSVLELWCDINQIKHIPPEIGNCKQLMFLDVSKNRLESIPPEIEGCTSLSDLHLSTNLIEQLPDSLGRLSNLTTLKIDDNQLISLPNSIGGLVSLSELNISTNDIEELPPSLGLLRHLRTIYADENLLEEIPPEMGSCNGLTVLSLRSNRIQYVPDELGRIPRLRVLNLSGNRIRFLPYSLIKLKQLQALWLAENQSNPLVKLQSEIDVETGRRSLTCFLLPQQPADDEDAYSDGDSFHPSLWEEERERRTQIHFGDLAEEEGKLERCPTPYPKEMKQRAQHMRNLAMKQSTPNGEVRWNTAERKVEKQPVKGRRERGSPERNVSGDGKVLETAFDQPTSPLLQERHILLKADKDKQAKDKARIQSLPSPPKNIEEAKKLFISDASYRRDGSPNKKNKDKSPGKDKRKDKSRSAEDDDGGFLSAPESGGRRGRSISPSSQHRAPPSGSLSNIYSPKQPMQQQQQPTPAMDNFPRSSSAYGNFGGAQSYGRGGQPGQPYYGAPPGAYQRPRTRGGYDSDNGYRSDHEVFRKRRQEMTGYMDGSQSDWEGSRMPQHQPARRHHRDGYNSDLEGYSGRNQAHIYRPTHAQTLAPIQAIDQRPQPPQQQQHQLSSNTLEKSQQQNYSNVPRTKRTTIRNDELYEVYKKAAGKPPQNLEQSPQKFDPNLRSDSKPKWPDQSYQAEANESNVNTTANTSQWLSQLPENQSQEIRDTDSQGSKTDYNRTNLEVNPVGFSTPRKDHSSAIAESGAGNRGSYGPVEGSDNPKKDEWKNEGYINKDTPLATPIKQPPGQQQQQQQQQQHKLNITPTPSEGDEVFHPPPYKPAPPYKPPRVSSLHQTPEQELAQYLSIINSQQKSTPSVDSHSTHSAELRNQSEYYQRSSADSGSVGQRSEYKGSPKRTDVWRTPSQRSDSRDSPYKGSQPEIRQSPYANRSRSLDAAGPPGGNKDNYDHSYKYAEHPQDTSSESLPPFNKNMSVVTTQFDKDVAVYKTTEPTSQVSSSTDSGYGHGHHIYERVGGEPGRSRVGTPTGNMIPPSRVPPSPPGWPQGNTPLLPPPSRDPPTAPSSYPQSPGQSAEQPALHKSQILPVTIVKNPGLGFSIAGGRGSPGNPFRPNDMGIFITKVQSDGPGAMTLLPGDKILEVNGTDFTTVDHDYAVTVLKHSGQSVSLLIERF